MHCIMDTFSGTLELLGGRKLTSADSGLSFLADKGVSVITVLLSTRCRADLFRKLHPRLSFAPLLCKDIQILIDSVKEANEIEI